MVLKLNSVTFLRINFTQVTSSLKMKYSLALFCALLISAFFTKSQAQDSITLKNSEVLLGSVTVQYKDTSDVVLLDQKKYNADEVSLITLESGEKYYSKKVVYYSKERFIEIEKNAILKERLIGAVNLYVYEGKHFNFVIGDKEKTKVLQELPQNVSTTGVQPFRIELINFLGDCIDREKIFKTKLNKNTLTALVNEYNICKDDDYVVLIEAKKKTKIMYAGISVGGNFAEHTYSASLFDIINSRIVKIGEIDQESSAHGSTAIKLKVSGNIKNSRSLFWDVFLSRRSYNFELIDTEDQFEIDDMRFTELDLGIGLTYKKELNQSFSFDFSTGGHVWVIPSTEIVNYSGSQLIPVHSSEHRQETGVGFYFGTNANLAITNKYEVFVGVSKYFRDTKNVMTANNGNQDGELRDLFVVSLGFKTKIFREGFF